ncbi:MAG: Gfo/Idh/MocA family oxidoreductase [Oscillospiraceae bacterium]|nr:Gfo/Idh/MocA family oxidoreductase [Oscillospiraceae bacterium]
MNFCFIGAGAIARIIMRDMESLEGCRLVSVVSRNGESAKSLAGQYGGRACASVNEALSCPGVDVAYISSTNDLHYEHTIAALGEGLAVLCEKPFAINRSQALEMVELAKVKGLYLAEGMWTRHNPVIKKALSWIFDGRIGNIRNFRVSFASPSDAPPEHRLMNPRLGGGSLLDIGVYGVAFAQMIMDIAPVSVCAAAEMTVSGVDGQCALTLRYPGGAIGRVFSSLTAPESNDAVIFGENGEIRIPAFWNPSKSELITPNGTECFEHPDMGYRPQLEAILSDLQAGRRENALVTHKFTLEVMDILDKARECITSRHSEL